MSNIEKKCIKSLIILRYFAGIPLSFKRLYKRIFEDEIINGYLMGMHFSDESETLSAVLDGMGTTVLPKVDAVTAVEDSNGRVVLIGMGGVAYDRHTTQHEELRNSHHLRAQGTIVNDVAEIAGGTQCLKFKNQKGRDVRISFDFDDHIMKVNLRTPTEDELTLGVNWLLPPMEPNRPQSIRRRRPVLDTQQIQVQGGVESSVPEEERPVHRPAAGPIGKGKRPVEEWKELLGFPSDEVVERTLDATTQLQVDPVEAERRDLPKQHRKKRLLMLHPKRLPGRADADTVFSTVKSIRGYLCVQFFCHVISDFLFISHSHGAYQDYIRGVGASESIVTDNLQTQT